MADQFVGGALLGMIVGVLCGFMFGCAHVRELRKRGLE